MEQLPEVLDESPIRRYLNVNQPDSPSRPVSPGQTGLRVAARPYIMSKHFLEMRSISRSISRRLSPHRGTNSVPQSPSGQRDVPHSPTGKRDVPRSPTGERDVPRSPIGERDVPQRPIGERGVPRSPIGERDFPQSPIGERGTVSSMLSSSSVAAGSILSDIPRPTSPDTVCLGVPFLAPEIAVGQPPPKRVEFEGARLARDANLSSIGAKRVVESLARFTKRMAGEPYHDKVSFIRAMREIGGDANVCGLLFDSLAHSRVASSLPAGAIPFADICVRMSLLCGGSEAEKIETVFSLVDLDHDGFLSMGELVGFFKLVFENVASRDEMMAKYAGYGLGGNPETFASQTAIECMRMCDLDENGQLGIDEFKKWFEQPAMSPKYSPFVQSNPHAHNIDSINLEDMK